MSTTRASLLVRIRDYEDVEAWSQFHELYAPMLYRYARARGLPPEDAEDVRDQCLVVVTRKITDFRYDRNKGGFKNWLYRIASGKVIDWMRRRKVAQADSQTLQRLRDSEPKVDDVWDHHWRNEHLKYCVEQVRQQVSETTYRAFHLLLFDGYSVEHVCEQLGMNANQVYKAKSRMLERIRQKLRELGVEAEIDTYSRRQTS